MCIKSINFSLNKPKTYKLASFLAIVILSKGMFFPPCGLQRQVQHHGGFRVCFQESDHQNRSAVLHNGTLTY